MAVAKTINIFIDLTLKLTEIRSSFQFAYRVRDFSAIVKNPATVD